MSAIDNYADAINEDDPENFDDDEDGGAPPAENAPVAKKSSNLPYIAVAAALTLVAGGFLVKNLVGPSSQEMPPTPLAQEMGVQAPDLQGAQPAPVAPMIPFDETSVSPEQISPEQPSPEQLSLAQGGPLNFEVDPSATPGTPTPLVSPEPAVTAGVPAVNAGAPIAGAPTVEPAPAPAAQPVAPLVVPAMPMPADTLKEVQRLREDIDQINRRLDTLVEELSTKIKAIESAQSKLAQTQRAPVKTVKTKVKPAPKVSAPSPTLHVSAMRSDKAWLKHAQNGDLITVEVGTHIAGLGTVKLIDIGSQSVVLESGQRISVQ